MKNKFQGFTLVELSVVITIIAILAVVIFIIVDPVEKLKENRDSQRLQEAQTIAEAIRLYKVDNNGDLLCGMDGENGVVGIGGTIDMRLSRYFSIVPKDPKYDDAPTNYRYYVDNFAVCYDAVTHARVSSDRGGIFVVNFESEKYQDEYSNYSSFCPSGSIYSGEAGGSSWSTFAYVIPFTPSCWIE